MLDLHSDHVVGEVDTACFKGWLRWDVQPHVRLSRALQSKATDNEDLGRRTDVSETAGLGSSGEGSSEGTRMGRVKWKRQGGIGTSRKSTRLMLACLCSDSFEKKCWWSRDSVCLLQPYSFPHPFMPYLIYRGT